VKKSKTVTKKGVGDDYVFDTPSSPRPLPVFFNFVTSFACFFNFVTQNKLKKKTWWAMTMSYTTQTGLVMTLSKDNAP